MRCEGTYFVNSLGECLQNCGSDAFGDKKSQSCVACPLGCNGCESLEKCTDCIEGYALTTTGQCKGCGDGCAVCENEECGTCNQGLYLDLSLQCVEHCALGSFIVETD